MFAFYIPTKNQKPENVLGGKGEILNTSKNDLVLWTKISYTNIKDSIKESEKLWLSNLLLNLKNQVQFEPKVVSNIQRFQYNFCVQVVFLNKNQ